ncbi:hypothetical protein [Streptomyces sp. NPDC001380]|uniref:hypothetical protein n=1 Tax=Streptomyces sp. NPDC001380 TaxID=3364566 RepID=UPI0036B8AE1B
MGKTGRIRWCEWCGDPLPEHQGPGRPRRYCRDSHKALAYQLRRDARLLQAMGVAEIRCDVRTQDHAPPRPPGPPPPVAEPKQGSLF